MERTLTSAASTTSETTRSSRWILHPWLDPVLLAFPWLPVYLFATLVLGEQQLASPVLDESRLFLLVLFAANFTHRNYTYLLVFGDRQTLAQRPLTFLLILGCAVVLAAAGSFELVPGLMPVLLLVIAVWNLQHVVMQRYGFLRVYGRKQGGGAETEAHGRRELWLLWSFVLLVLSCWLFTDDPRYRYFVARAGALELGPLTALMAPVFAALPWVALTLSAPFFAWSALRWLRHELAAPVSFRDGWPRLLFLLSSVLLYSIALGHGIFLAFLCVMASHAVEYVAFVHAHWRRRYRTLDRRAGWAVPLLRSSLLSFALLGGGGFLLYCLELSALPKTSGWLGLYLTVTVLVHFSFDGLIWHRGGPTSRGGAFA